MRTLIQRGNLGTVIALMAALVASGCGSEPTTRPSASVHNSDRALADPMNWKPDFSKDRVSSGGIGDLDKDGLKRDLKSVFNP